MENGVWRVENKGRRMERGVLKWSVEYRLLIIMENGV